MVSKKGFWRITFDTNPNDCNLHCIMCEHHSKYSVVEKNRILANVPKKRMPIDLIRGVLENAKNSSLCEIIPSTMGEPLLYKDFDKIIEMCKEFSVKLNLTTNGTFPVRGARNWAERIVPVASDVKISWNGATKATQEKIMQGTDFEQGINNIKDFLEIRNKHADCGGNYCQVTLQLTFMETNINELEDIVRLGISLGVDRIKGHHLWTNFKEIEPLSLRKDTESIDIWNRIILKIRKTVKNNILPNGKQIKLVNFDLLNHGAVKNLLPEGICPFLGKEAWIDPDGRFSPCCAPDLLRKQLGDFGNVSEKNILDIWCDAKYQDLLQNYMTNDVCISCNMRRLPSNVCWTNEEDINE